MVIYNKDDKSLEIPNGLGNLSITINEGGGETPDLTNYATTSYVDEEILKVNSEIETINEDINVLEGRIIDLENNGGGSSEGGNDVVYFNFDIEDGEFNVNDDFNFKTVAQALKENKIVYVNGYLVTSYFLNEYLLGEIFILANDTIVRFSASFTNFLHTTVEVTSNGFVIPDGEVMYGELSSINERVTELENISKYLFKDENYTISPTNIISAKTALKAGKRVVLNNYFSNSETLFEVIGYDEYEINDEWYSSISAIKGDYLYIWSTEFESAGNVIPRKIYIPTNTADLQAQIEANTTRINNVEQVKILDVSNGMTKEQFNDILNNFKSKNYKYLLNVNGNDFFEICSVQYINKFITAVGYDDYEEEMVSYTWGIRYVGETPFLIKRRLTATLIS